MLQLLLLALCFPETAHPGTRGIDKAQGPRRLFVFLNPFRCVALLRSPNIMAIVRIFCLFGGHGQLLANNWPF